MIYARTPKTHTHKSLLWQKNKNNKNLHINSIISTMLMKKKVYGNMHK